MPGIAEPIPPNPWFKEAVAKGLVPREWYEGYVSSGSTHRCLCTHQQGAHPKDGPCQAKVCRRSGRCAAYAEDPRYTIPEWGSQPKAIVSPVVPLEVPVASFPP